MSGNLFPPAGRVYYQVSGGGDPRVTSTNAVSLGVWHHAAFTYSVATLTLRVYVDGNLNVSQLSIPSPNPSIAMPLRIGADTSIFTYCWHGCIDDIRIYRRALAADEIRQLYQEPPAPGGLFIRVR